MSQPFPRPPFPQIPLDLLRARLVGWSLVAALGLASSGCQPQAEIHKYRIPKELAKADPPAAENLPPGRMLAAIVLRPGKAWFFKLSGPLAAVSAHAEEFDKLIASLRFEGDAPPRWETPAGWSEEGASGMRFATLKSPADAPPTEVSITTLPFAGGENAEADQDYLLFNINRWRGQMSAQPIKLDQLAAESKQVDLHGASATVVDIVGQLAPTGMGPGAMRPGTEGRGIEGRGIEGRGIEGRGIEGRGIGGQGEMAARPLPPMAAGGDRGPQSESPAEPGRMLAAMVLRPDVGASHPGEGWFFKLAGPSAAVAKHAAEFQKFIASLRFGDRGQPEWQAPADWTSGPSNPMRYATLVLPGESPLELTISNLPFDAADPLDYALKNVNRWRGQLRLPPTTREQLSAELQRVALADGEALVVDLSRQPAAKPNSESSPAPGAEHGN